MKPIRWSDDKKAQAKIVYPKRGFDDEYDRQRALHEARKNEGRDWEAMEPSTLSAPFSRTRVRKRRKGKMK